MSGPGEPIRRVVIVGGGTAGWMVAAAAARYLDDGQRRITLIESDEIGTVGVGEATIPPIRTFNGHLGVDEEEFLAATGATFKLGIEFVDWGRIGDRYFHPFGTHGRDFEGVAFHQHWLKQRRRPDTLPIERYSICAAAAAAGRFAPPTGDARMMRSDLRYAYHFDAALYAAFLRRRAEAGGVERLEGRIATVERNGESGFVAALLLSDGRRIEGDFFIDCSGFRSLLLGQTQGVPYRDWSHWLPCDRAIAVPTDRTEPLLPFTRASAGEAGWRWRIPLQHRTGNGHVYSSRWIDDDRAHAALIAGLDAPATAEPRRLSFTAGARARMWERNVVALGLAAGFIEPLESTSIHLVQTAISTLFFLFPDRRFADVEAREFNRLMTEQFEYVRDFIILHYKATTRDDSGFWRHVREMAVPDTLATKIELFRTKGRARRTDENLFDVPSWVAVMLGQGIDPQGYDPLVDAMDEGRVRSAMAAIAGACAAEAAAMPTHTDYLRARRQPR